MDAGNLVKVDETVLSTIVSLEPIYVTFGVDERLLRRVHSYVEKGLVQPTQDNKIPLLMGLAVEDGFPHVGTVNFIDNHLDLNTATLQVHGIFANPKRTILPGLFARVRLPLGQPYRALQFPNGRWKPIKGRNSFTWSIRKTKFSTARWILAGRMARSRVILKGVNEDDRVVVSGLQRVRPGVVVQPKLTSTAAQADAKTPPTVQTAIQSTERSEGEKR